MAIFDLCPKLRLLGAFNLIEKLNLGKTAKITVVGNAENLTWVTKEGKVAVQIPEKLAKKIPNSYAYVLKITK